MSKVFEFMNYLRLKIAKNDNEDEIIETYNVSMKNTLIRSGNDFNTFVFSSSDIPDFSLCISKNSPKQEYSKIDYCCNYFYNSKITKLEVDVHFQDSCIIFNAHDPSDNYFIFRYQKKNIE